MNKSELVKAVAGHTGLTQADTSKTIDALIEVVTGQVKKGEKVALAGFGTFERKERPAREGRNPRTGETVKIPARKSAAFKPAAALKEL